MIDFAPYDDLLSPHDYWMRQALDQARFAFEQGEVPVGAVVVQGENIIGLGCNQRETLKDPTAHAEIMAITQAAQTLGSWRLIDCSFGVIGVVPLLYCLALLKRLEAVNHK